MIVVYSNVSHYVSAHGDATFCVNMLMQCNLPQVEECSAAVELGPVTLKKQSSVARILAFFRPLALEKPFKNYLGFLEPILSVEEPGLPLQSKN